MSKKKLQAARELIREKHYDEARAILKTVDHPTAHEWLKKLDTIAPEKTSDTRQKLFRAVLPRRGRGRLYWIGLTVFLCMACYVFSLFGQFIGFIPTADERNATSTLEVATQVAQAATQTSASQMTTDAQATIIVLTPPTPTATITETPIPTEIPTITNTPLPTDTRPPTSTATPKAFSASEYQRLIADGLFLTAGGRNIETIQVADGRPNGGERVAIISYLTTETTEVGFVEEWIDIFSGLAATISAHKLDIDLVTLVAGTPTGQAAGAISTSASNLLAFHNGNITRGQFLDGLEAVAF